MENATGRIDDMEREQTTIRLPAELKRKVTAGGGEIRNYLLTSGLLVLPRR